MQILWFVSFKVISKNDIRSINLSFALFSALLVESLSFPIFFYKLKVDYKKMVDKELTKKKGEKEKIKRWSNKEKTEKNYITEWYENQQTNTKQHIYFFFSKTL